eukprot:1154606-Pelagomonas_calceolata.AAC.1
MPRLIRHVRRNWLFSYLGASEVRQATKGAQVEKQPVPAHILEIVQVWCQSKISVQWGGYLRVLDSEYQTHEKQNMNT